MAVPGSKPYDIAVEILTLSESFLDENPPFQADLEEIHSCMQCIFLRLSRRDQSRELRYRTLALCRRVINKDSRWDAKAFLMGTSAFVSLEEAGRDEGGSGSLTTIYD